MHGRIFEISKTGFKDKSFHYLFSYEDLSQLPRIADYVEDSHDRNEDINHLRNELSRYKGIIFDESYFIVGDNFQEEYFFERFNEFQKIANELSIKEFSSRTRGKSMTYDIQKLIEDDLDIRVFCHDRGHISLDEFVRNIEPNTRYYIGGVGDYSF